jgi:hypothetical protein
MNQQLEDFPLSLRRQCSEDFVTPSLLARVLPPSAPEMPCCTLGVQSSAAGVILVTVSLRRASKTRRCDLLPNAFFPR